MTSLIVDTNAYSRFRRGDARAVTALRTAPEIHLPLIVLGELLAGFAAGSRPAQNRDELAQFMASARVHLMKPDEKTAHEYSQVHLLLRRAGLPIPTNDLWIAALTRQHRLPLLTFDAHFASIPGVALA